MFFYAFLKVSVEICIKQEENTVVYKLWLK
jgi:hypothetical protein